MNIGRLLHAWMQIGACDVNEIELTEVKPDQKTYFDEYGRNNQILATGW